MMEHIDVFDLFLTRGELAALRHCLLMEMLRRDARSADVSFLQTLADELVQRARPARPRFFPEQSVNSGIHDGDVRYTGDRDDNQQREAG